jgi:hypothetical protein
MGLAALQLAFDGSARVSGMEIRPARFIRLDGGLPSMGLSWEGAAAESRRRQGSERRQEKAEQSDNSTETIFVAKKSHIEGSTLVHECVQYKASSLQEILSPARILLADDTPFQPLTRACTELRTRNGSALSSFQDQPSRVG